MQDFVERIKKMNEVFKIESNDSPKNLGVKRIDDFYKVINEEILELLLTVEQKNNELTVDLTGLADTLGDIVVYCFSEARRWGIPMLPVLNAIMDSQDSKLIDGKPIYSEDGSKFIKGPNYKPPEEAIAALLKD